MVPFLEFVENKIIADSNDRTMKSAVMSVIESFTSQSYDDVTDESLRGWIADMIISGLKPNSRKKYLGIISSLYREWRGDDGEMNPFASVKELAETDTESEIKRVNSNRVFLRRLLNVSRDSEDYETVNLFLYLLYNVEAGLSDVIKLTFYSDMPHVSQIDDIVEKMLVSKRKKYVFCLDQGKKREGQILRDMLHEISTVIGGYGFDFGGEFSRDSITSLWIAAALKAGVTVTEIRSIVKNIPKDYSYIQFVRPTELNRADKLRILQKVADSIHDGSPQWFVMKMRSGRTLDDIKFLLNETDENLLKEILFYYPSHKVVTVDKAGKKRWEEKPYLPGILFFKIRKDKVTELFRHIGTLAWCYKWTNTPDSPYCIIPMSEMKAFQRHVGSFTPDIQIRLVTLDAPLAVDQKVRINGGGLMENQIGIIQSVKNNNGTRTYTLALSGRDYATWTVKDVEEIYIEPINA